VGGVGGGGGALVLSQYSLLRNPLTKPTGVLGDCREKGTNFWLSIFQGVSFWRYP